MSSSDVKLAALVKFNKEHPKHTSLLPKKDTKKPPKQVKIYEERPEPVMPQTTVIDPFDKVLLLKNIDNAILTSFRTLNKQNNQISHTLKVIHNKFTPKQLTKQVKNTFKKAQQALYSVSEVESIGSQFTEDEQSEHETEHYIINTEENADKDTKELKSQIAQNHNINLQGAQQNVDESLLSSMEMSPAVGKLNTTSSRGTKRDKDGKVLTLFASKDQLALKSSIATVEANENDCSGSKARVTSREFPQLSPATVEVKKERTDGHVIVSRASEKEVNFIKHQQEVIKADKILKTGEQTFTDLPRKTAGFGATGSDDDIKSSGRVMSNTAKDGNNQTKPASGQSERTKVETVINSKQYVQQDTVETRQNSVESDSGGNRKEKENGPTKEQY